MELKDFTYSVAIRTLGQAGDKFRQELESLHRQTIQPQRILVYIAEGFPRPDFTVGREEYVPVKKGMVAQRALPYDEVSTPYLLLLDDDVLLPDDGVERLATALLERDADCIAPDVFHPQDSTFVQTVYNFLTNLAFPRLISDGRAFRIYRTASFSYPLHPRRGVYPSQSAAGPASLWRKEAFLDNHFESELWLDELGFAYGEDLLCYNKLVRCGGHLLVHYGTDIQHLDAQTSRRDYSAQRDRLMRRTMIQYILWHRTQLDAADLSSWRRFTARLAWGLKVAEAALLHIGYAIVKLQPSIFLMFIRGLREGRRYVRSERYRSIPNFVARSSASALASSVHNPQ